jgi:hypothetical protein
MSIPKKRNNPYIAGLSKHTLQLLDLDYDEIIKDPNTPLYLSGSKLINGSKVNYYFI